MKITIIIMLCVGFLSQIAYQAYLLGYNKGFKEGLFEKKKIDNYSFGETEIKDNVIYPQRSGIEINVPKIIIENKKVFPNQGI